MKVKIIIASLAVPALLLQACSPKLHLSGTEKNQYMISSQYPADSVISAYYQSYKHQLDSIMNDVVAVSEIEIQKSLPEGTLNNFFADAMYSSAKERGLVFDFAYTNYGGLRTSIPKGNVPRYKIFELMPFENALATARFKGSDIQEFFNYLARAGGEAISGACFTIDKNKAVDITVNDQPLDLNREYIVLTSDYMATGGDGGEIFPKALEIKSYDYKLRDAILNYLENIKKTGKTLNPVKDGRVKIK
jgi:2',3'-cyclic-nucleotide 2'-phosphodiesterase (5'-nucleotidase family)